MKPFLFFLKPHLPTQSSRESISRIDFFLNAARFQLVGFLIMGAILLIDSILAFKLGYNSFVRQSLNKFNDRFNDDLVSILVLGCLIGPIIEEIAFRSFLNFKKLYVSLSIASLSYIILRMFFSSIVQCSVDRWSTAVVSLLGAGLFFIYTPDKFFDEMKRNFKPLFYTSILIFALIHLSNYDLSQFTFANFATIPVLLFPQIIAAINLSYLRIYCGLLWSIVFHCLLNAIIFSPVLMRAIL